MLLIQGDRGPGDDLTKIKVKIQFTMIQKILFVNTHDIGLFHVILRKLFIYEYKSVITLYDKISKFISTPQKHMFVT